MNYVKVFIFIVCWSILVGGSCYWYGLHDIGGTAITVREKYDAVTRINQQLAEDASELRQINNRLRTEIVQSQRDAGQIRENNNQVARNNNEAATIIGGSQQILRQIRQGK
jgi:hypothetical protein